VNHNPVLQRYVPARSPASSAKSRCARVGQVRGSGARAGGALRRVCEHLAIPFEERAIHYGRAAKSSKASGTRPASGATRSRDVVGLEVAAEIASDPPRRWRSSRVCSTSSIGGSGNARYRESRSSRSSPPRAAAPLPVKAKGPLRYRLQRKALVALRRNVHQNALGRVASGFASRSTSCCASRTSHPHHVPMRSSTLPGSRSPLALAFVAGCSRKVSRRPPIRLTPHHTVGQSRLQTGRYGELGVARVPYAAPPVGDLRCALPRRRRPGAASATPSANGRRACSTRARWRHPDGAANTRSGTRTALLNVYAPKTRDADVVLPVMLWIHGGGNTIGAASSTTAGTSRRRRTSSS